MKPRLQRFFKGAIPSIIVLPAMVQLASAAIILPNGAGDVLITLAGSGPNNIQTGFGGPPPAGSHQILINAGATVNPLAGDVIEIQVSNASAAFYTITNNGSLVSNGGVGNHGIDTADLPGFTPSITVNNTGSITGASAIRANNTLTLTNSGLLSGIGVADAAVYARNGGTITNNTGGSISGLVHGVISDSLTGNLLLNNSGTIASNNGDGVRIVGTATVNNFAGSITGSVNGLIVGNNAQILNNATITGGTLDGISAGSGLTLTNSGIIQTTGDDGVSAGSGALISNSGLIQGSFGTFLFAGNSTVTNSGTIRGNLATAILVGFGTGVTINNSALITSPTNAFSGNLGNDVLNLAAGSRLVGNVLGGGGTDTINFTGGLTAPGGLDNSIRGNVAAFTSINKSGTGVAFIGLPGDPAYTISADTIAISSGGLYLNGSVTGNLALQSTLNANGSALGGTGLWNANVNLLSGGFSAGAIPINLDSNPLNSVGAVTLTGNVVHSAGSFIRFDVVPDAPVNNGINSDLITQTGLGNSYNLTGANLRISSTNQNRVIRDGTYTVVDSNTAIVGYPALGTLGVQYNANVNATDTGFVGSQVPNSATSDTTNVLARYFTTTTLADAGTNLVLNVQHDFAGLPGLTANQVSLAGAIDASTNSPNPLTQDFIAALDNSDLFAVQASLAALDPSTYLGFTTVTMNSNYRLHRMVQDHLATVRDGGESMTETSAPTRDSKGGMIPGESVTRTSGKGNVWGAVSYDSQDYDVSGSQADFNGDAWSFTAGFDWRVGPELVLGVVLDGSRGTYDGLGTSTDVDSYRGALYGTWGSSMGLYSDFLVGYGDHSMDSSGALGGVLGGLATANQDATSLQALWTIGYAMGNQQVKHGPFIGLESQNVDADGFTTTGPLPIAVGGRETDSLRGLVGYRVNGNYGTLRPYASVAYAYEFEDGPNRSLASFGGVPFSISGADQSSAILITAGTGIVLTSYLTLDVGYRGEIADDDGLTSHGGSIGLNYSF